jgi:hypothetical protein
MKWMGGILALLLVAGIGSAGAEERFGVEVYPGAATDAAADTYCTAFNQEEIANAKEQIVSESACFRSSDDFIKIVGFYQHDKELMPLGQPIDKGLQRSALFCLHGMKCASLGDGVDVMISTPWTDGKNRYPDVLILMRKASRR